MTENANTAVTETNGAETQESEAEINVEANATEEMTAENQEQEAEATHKSVEDMLSDALAEITKLKRERDKASREAVKYKQESLANKSESERKAIEKAEEDARIKEELAELRKESALNKLEKSFVALGYSEEMAKQAAEAQYEGNTDLLFQIQKKFFTEKEKQIKAKLMRDMPAPSIGNDDTISVTKEQFDKMGYKERVELAKNHPKVYEQLTK